MDTNKIFINGESLNSILRHYYNINILIKEIKRMNGNFFEWDEKRSIDTVKTHNAEIEIKDLVL